jgi:integration host factor subunit beta
MAAHFWGIRSYLSYFTLGNIPMNKSDLVTILSRKEELKEKDATDIINLIFDGFARALKNGGRVEIRGFGNFSVRQYENRRNSRHRTNITPNKLPFFKAGKEIKEKVNGGRP